MREILLNKGGVALVDDENYGWLSQWKWTLCTKCDGRLKYAVRRANGQEVSMHREIMGDPKGLQVDHRDCNGLNNCKSNLRICTAMQNQQNARPRKDGTSQYKGVQWNKNDQRWRAVIRVQKTLCHIGNFKSEFDAAQAYDSAARQHFGEFARTNF